MNIHTISLLIALTAVITTACRNNDTPFIPSTEEKEISVYMQVKVPGIGKRGLRAVDEEAINNIFVLVLEDTGDGYQYNYGVAGYGLSAGTTPYDYRFYARLTPTTNPLKFYLLANTGAATNILTQGMTEEQIRQSLTGTYPETEFDTTLPMFGELELTGGLTEDTELPVVLVRSAARVDVRNTAPDFILTSVQLYRASNQYQIIPDSMTDDLVTVPSIPAGTTQSIDTDPVSVTGNLSQEQIYLPESPVTPEADRQTAATIVVVGGLYGTDTTPTYYQMDFVPDNDPALFGQVLRNHRYFSISTPYWPQAGAHRMRLPSIPPRKLRQK
ncbi:MAG: hypothetical protein LUD15_07125 [Bacteroides sp.]|nr:hypothetical protein [Bacteroides sp.]